MRTLALAISAIGLALVFAMAATGCGGNDDTSATEAQTGGEAKTGGGASPEAGGKQLEIKMGDYFFAPTDATVSAAKSEPLTINAPNRGKVEHELVLFKTGTDPARLPTSADGGVDEEKLDKVAEEVGEIADVEPGASESARFKLSPGTYVMFCNLPGHYAQGMYGTLTVTR